MPGTDRGKSQLSEVIGGCIRNCSKTTSFKMMNNANDGAEAAHSKSFLYPFERIRKISVARVH